MRWIDGMLKLRENPPIQFSRNVLIIRNKECIGNGETYYGKKGKSKSKIARNGGSEENKPKRSKY